MITRWHQCPSLGLWSQPTALPHLRTPLCLVRARPGHSIHEDILVQNRAMTDHSFCLRPLWVYEWGSHSILQNVYSNQESSRRKMLQEGVVALYAPSTSKVGRCCVAVCPLLFLLLEVSWEFTNLKCCNLKIAPSGFGTSASPNGAAVGPGSCGFRLLSTMQQAWVLLPNLCPDGFMGPKKTTCAVPTRISPPDHQARPTNPSPEHYEFDKRQKLESLCALGMIGYDHVSFQSFPTVTPCLGVGQALAWSDWLRDRWADLQGLTWLIWTSLWNDGLLSLPHLPSSISQHLMIFHGLRGRLHQDPVLQLIVAAARSRHDPRAHNHWIVQRKREVIEIDWSMVNPELQQRVGHKFPIWRSGESEKPFWVNVILPYFAPPKTSPGFGAEWLSVLNLHSDFFFPYSTAFFQDGLPIQQALQTWFAYGIQLPCFDLRDVLETICGRVVVSNWVIQRQPAAQPTTWVLTRTLSLVGRLNHLKRKAGLGPISLPRTLEIFACLDMLGQQKGCSNLLESILWTPFQYSNILKCGTTPVRLWYCHFILQLYKPRSPGYFNS